MFQSLSGFQVRCNVILVAPGKPIRKSFQSLSGFQVRCNVVPAVWASVELSVSIPVGFSSPLQQLSGKMARFARDTVSIPVGFSSPLQPNGIYVHSLYGKVSIPVGFSSPLQPNWKCVTNRKGHRFQSLSGFQVRCNSKEPIIIQRPGKSFNPCRVFKSAATGSSKAEAGCIFGSFNPCRVFKSAATLQPASFLISSSKFQSLSGFQVRCNLTNRDICDRRSKVSIPVGFSSPLQRQG